MFVLTMRTNGFILVGLISAVTVWAGPAGYLPKIGPVALRFQVDRPIAQPVALAVLISQPENPVPPAPVVPVPAPRVETPTATPEAVDTNQLLPTLMKDPPIIAPLPPPTPLQSEPMLSPGIGTNGSINLQTFMRFFSPAQLPAGVSRDTIVVPPIGFNPGRPAPTPSSTATYSQPSQ